MCTAHTYHSGEVVPSCADHQGDNTGRTLHPLGLGVHSLKLTPPYNGTGNINEQAHQLHLITYNHYTYPNKHYTCDQYK